MVKVIAGVIFTFLYITSVWANSCSYTYDKKVNELTGIQLSHDDETGKTWFVEVMAVGFAVGTNVLLNGVSAPDDQRKIGGTLATIPAFLATGNLISHYVKGDDLNKKLLQYTSVVDLYKQSKSGGDVALKKLAADILKVKESELQGKEDFIESLRKRIVSEYEDGKLCLAGNPLSMDGLKSYLKSSVRQADPVEVTVKVNETPREVSKEIALPTQPLLYRGAEAR